MSEQTVPRLGWLYVYLTRDCNLNCGHCWLDAGARDQTALDVDRVVELARQAKPLGLIEVRLTGGEPTIVPHFARLVEELGRLEVRIHIETNAMDLSPEVVDVLANNNTSLGISLDGDEAYHDRMRGVRGAYRRTLETISRLTTAGVRRSLVMALRRSNTHLLEDVADVARKYGIECVKINPVLPMGRGKRLPDLLTARDCLELNHENCKRNTTNPAIFFDLPAAFYPLRHMSRVPRCQYLNTISVLADGTLALCGLGFDHPDWRVEQDYDDLATLWRESRVLERIRTELPAALDGICGDCMMRAGCRGACRALALMIGGSWTAAHPWCVDLYEAGLFPTARLKTGA